MTRKRTKNEKRTKRFSHSMGIARHMLAVVLAFAMVVTTMWGGAGAVPVQAAVYDSFTLYFYYESETAVNAHIGIWNKKGIGFAEGTETSTAYWGSNSTGVMKPVEGIDNLYSIGIKILSAAEDDGFSVLLSSENTVVEFDNQWNNTEDYATLVSGASDAYVIKNNTLYTSLEAAGISISDGDDYNAKLAKLLNDLPAESALGSFSEETANALRAAKASAEALASDASDEDVKKAYQALEKALKGLRLNADIFVDPIEGITDDAIRGMDLSTFVSMMDSFDALNQAAGEQKFGYRDFEGNLLTRQGFFNFLAAQGVNYARVRVWVDPYDSEHHGYGGGNNDVEKALEIGKYAANAGIKMLIDFHYSDFWADPSKQQAPKAWKSLGVQEKAEKIREYTTEALETLLDGGVDVAMVQVGNETNGAMCGVSGSGNWTDNLDVLFDAGCDAVHDTAKKYNRQILAAVHFTDPQKEGRQAGYAANLAAYNDGEGVSYDVFATSYYPYWHGSLANLRSVLSNIAKKYDKYVMVAETSYAFGIGDTDGHDDNTVSETKNNTGENLLWPFTVQGQANEFRAVMNSVIGIQNADGEDRGLGLFWWEGAWMGVQNVYNEDGSLNQTLLNQNKSLWEQYGSGWASSYGGQYDPNDAGKWYGGDAIENQCFFDVNGYPLASIGVFNPSYLSTGAVGVKKVDGVSTDATSMEVGQTMTAEKLGKAKVTYNDGSEVDGDVNWDVSEIDSLNEKAETAAGIGEYTVHGMLAEDESWEVEITVSVIPKNLIANYSFEDSIAGNWTISSIAMQTGDDPRTGKKSIHFYDGSAFDFTVTQEIPVEAAGLYGGYVYAQGKDATVQLKLIVGNQEYASEEIELTGWNVWKQPVATAASVTADMLADGAATVTYQVHVAGSAGGWGTLDDAYFYLEQESSDEPVDDPSDKPSDEPGEKPSDEPVEKPSDKPVDNPSEKPSDKPADNPSDKPSDKPADNQSASGYIAPAASQAAAGSNASASVTAGGSNAEDTSAPTKDTDNSTSDGSTVSAGDTGKDTGSAASYKAEITEDGELIIVDSQGEAVTNKLVQLSDGTTCYATKDGTVASGTVVKAGSKKYYANEQGEIVKGGFFTTEKGNKIYAKKTGELVVKKVFQVKGAKYYASKNGNIVKNKWVKVGKKKYYCSASGKITKIKKVK